MAMKGAEGIRQALEKAPVPLDLRGRGGGAVELLDRLLQLCEISHGRKCIVHNGLQKRMIF